MEDRAASDGMGTVAGRQDRPRRHADAAEAQLGGRAMTRRRDLTKLSTKQLKTEFEAAQTAEIVRADKLARIDFELVQRKRHRRQRTRRTCRHGHSSDDRRKGNSGHHAGAGADADRCLAQSRTFYDASGRVTGRSTSGSSGSTTIYDASGRVTGRIVHGSNRQRSTAATVAASAVSRQPSRRADDMMQDTNPPPPEVQRLLRAVKARPPAGAGANRWDRQRLLDAPFLFHQLMAQAQFEREAADPTQTRTRKRKPTRQASHDRRHCRRRSRPG